MNIRKEIMKYIIPARKGSKGLKHKNRLLFDYTAKTIPTQLSKNVYVTTDDEWIIERAKKYNFNFLNRQSCFASDDASIRDVLLELIHKCGISGDLTMLYLTYPKRTWNDIINFEKFYVENGKNPTLCKKKLKTHPYLCYYDIGSNKGKKIVQHDLYRRQEYPKCFEVSHFLFSCKASEINYLDSNLFCDKTNFYEINEENGLDIDSLNDFNKFLKGNNNKSVSL